MYGASADALHGKVCAEKACSAFVQPRGCATRHLFACVCMTASIAWPTLFQASAKSKEPLEPGIIDRSQSLRGTHNQEFLG